MANLSCGTMSCDPIWWTESTRLRSPHHPFSNHTASPLRLEFHDFSSTRLAVLNNHNRSDYSLDTRLIYTTTVDVPGHPGFPVVGGLPDRAGRKGTPDCLLRSLTQDRLQTVSMPRSSLRKAADASETFLKLMKHVKLEKYNSSLAYFMAPAFTKQ